MDAIRICNILGTNVQMLMYRLCAHVHIHLAFTHPVRSKFSSSSSYVRQWEI